VLEQEPADPRMLDPRADRDLSVIRAQCLEKEPGKRYGSADAFADELDRWLRGEPILARPVGVIGKAAKWVRRRPVVAGLTACCRVGITRRHRGLDGLWPRCGGWQAKLAKNSEADAIAKGKEAAVRELQAKQAEKRAELKRQEAETPAVLSTASPLPNSIGAATTPNRQVACSPPLRLSCAGGSGATSTAYFGPS